jgi:hypothetical protein
LECVVATRAAQEQRQDQQQQSGGRLEAAGARPVGGDARRIKPAAPARGRRQPRRVSMKTNEA